MDGRDFLKVAQGLASGPEEAYWRSAVGRAYYALIHEGRALLERWGFVPPPKADLHKFVRFRFTNPADVDLKWIGDVVDRLSRWRNQCDYQLGLPGLYSTPKRAQNAVADTAAALALMDQLDADPVRRAAAVAAIRAAFGP
jgi:hypothetical protein